MTVGRRSPRRTGPDAATVHAVRERDGHQCAGCGTASSLTTQHRRARGMGGTSRREVNLPSSLLTLCGSGTQGCHGWAEAHPERARELGWSVPSWADPESLPVKYWDGRWYLLVDDTRVRTDPLATEAPAVGS